MIHFIFISFIILLCTNCKGKSVQAQQHASILTNQINADSCESDSIEEYVADFIKRYKDRTHLVYRKVELSNDLKQFFIDSIISYARQYNYSPDEYTISIRAPRGYLLKDNVFWGLTSIYLEKNDYYSDGTSIVLESVPYYSEVDSFKCFIDYPTYRQYGTETSDSLIKEIATLPRHKKICKMNHRWFFNILISKEGTSTFIKLSEEDIDFNSAQLFFECITNDEIKGYCDD